MAPMSSTERGKALLEIAGDSILHGLHHGAPVPVDASALARELSEVRATFTTLKIEGRLRGCIGSLEAVRPVASDVAETAFGAAFRDPRFPPVTRVELDLIAIKVSVLSPMESLEATCDEELLAAVRPGIDGIFFDAGRLHATFLPAVWQTLPDPEDFLAQLKLKMGIPPDHWPEGMKVWRYTSEEFPAELPEAGASQS